MGIDIDGALLIGNKGSEFTRLYDEVDDLLGFLYDKGIGEFSPYRSNGFEDNFFGFKIPNTPIREITTEWLLKINDLGVEFEEITGAEAMIIGTENVW